MKINLKVYKIPASHFEPINDQPEYFLGYKLIIYKPGFFCRPEFGTSFKRNFLWNLITANGYSIILLLDGNKVVHYKEIARKNFRARYMGRNDVHHQQAFTNPEYRGRGISTAVHGLIGGLYGRNCDFFWVYHDVVNHASQRVIEKVGYEFFSFATLNSHTKIVRLVNKS